MKADLTEMAPGLRVHSVRVTKPKIPEAIRWGLNLYNQSINRFFISTYVCPFLKGIHKYEPNKRNLNFCFKTKRRKLEIKIRNKINTYMTNQSIKLSIYHSSNTSIHHLSNQSLTQLINQPTSPYTINQSIN